jgi:galactonate dehydratase
VPWRFEVLSRTLPFEGGVAQLPTAPGLGVEVDESAARRHPYRPEPQIAATLADGSVADW